MPDELPVHISRNEIHGLEVPAAFAADGSFDVLFLNHGQSVHVHVHLGDDLSKIASVDANNHYVEGESRRAVRVTVDADALPDDPVAGKLKLVSAYGAKTRWVDVKVSPPEEQDGSVEVDESLAEPQPRENDHSSESLALSPEIQVLALAAIVLVIALLAAVLIQDTLVLGGALAVLGGVFGAVYFLLQ